MNELLEFRTISQKMADDHVLKNITHLKYECEEEDDDIPYQFPKRVRHAQKVVIRNICGTIEHLKRVEEIGKNQIGDIEYLFLEFDDTESVQDSDDIAR